MPGLCGHGAPPLHADQAEPGPGARPRRGSPPDRGPARNPCLGDRGGRARGPPRAPRRRRRRGGGLVPPLCRRPHRGGPARVPRCLEPSRRAGPKPLFMLMSPKPLVIAGVEFSSRLFVGTAKFSSGEIMRRSPEASGTQLVTVALGRVLTGGEPDDILGHLDPGRFRLLPNTSGTRNAREAVLAAELAREALETNWLKLEIHPDPKYLMPDATETLQATELLAKRGFVVLPYVHADPVLCKRLEDAGAAAVMPLGAPIGSNLGLESRVFLEIIIAQSGVPVVVDAGLGAPSHAAAALEMGADAVLVNTAIAAAAGPGARGRTRDRDLAADVIPWGGGPVSFIDVWRRHDFGDVTRRIASRTPADVRRALGRARGSVDLEDFAALLSPAASPFLEDRAQAARQHTVERFGRTMRLYAPLYLSNACANVCTYCGFSAHNKIRRKVLSDAEILAEAGVLRAHGFDSVLLVTGETGRVGRDYLANALRLLRPHFSGLWIEVQPLPQEDYAALAKAGLSAVLVYQETYDEQAYLRHHLSGPKSDMGWRLGTPDRLGLAGMKKIGLGALFGLSDWRADAWFTGLHLRHVE